MGSNLGLVPHMLSFRGICRFQSITTLIICFRVLFLLVLCIWPTFFQHQRCCPNAHRPLLQEQANPSKNQLSQ